MKKSNITCLNTAVVGFVASFLCVALASTLLAQLPATPGSASQNPFLDAQESTADGLRSAIVKYPYSWEHEDISQPITFQADGTAGGGKLNWRARGTQEIELWHINAPDKKIVLKFSSDYTSYVGTDFQGKRLTGRQILPKSQASPTPAGVQADDVANAATINVLTSGDWRLVAKKWSNVDTFKRDHTVVEHEHAPKQPPTWEISGNKVIIQFPNHQFILSLPLNPRGTNGINTEDNTEFVATWMAPSTEGAKPQSPKPAGGGDGSGVFGSKNPGPGVTQVSTPPPAPISPETQQAASDLVKTYHNDLVFVTGREGAGSGFIASMGGKNYLVTNAHVAAGINDASFKTLDDTAVQGGTPSVAVGRDIFCMAMPAGGKPLEIMDDVEGTAGIGDDVVVLGNAEGEGVVNTIIGKIVGIGADRVEVDAPFVPGNSGSPIIHLKTGKVIGIATYTTIRSYDPTTNEKIARPVIRRFGYRLDNVKGWQTVDRRAFYAQAVEMKNIETLTSDLGDFFDDLNENKGSVTAGRHTNPVIKNRIDEWIDDKSHHLSAEDAGTADANFLSFLKVACQSDVTAARQHMTYDYFQRDLADQQQARDEMAKAFEELIKGLRN